MDLKGIRILLVDDEPDLLAFYRLAVEGLGAIPTTALNGKEALALLKPGAFDCVWTDIRMPQGSGLELLQAIHGSGKGGPAVFVITGDLEITDEELEKLGASGVFRKPFSLSAAVTAVRRVLAR